MTGSTITLTRESTEIARLTYANPPVNLIVGDTVRDLTEALDGILDDPRLQVLVLDSGTPDFFYNHFDLAHLDKFPGRDQESGHAAFTEITLRLSASPVMTVGVIRGRTRGGGNELALALDLRYASREKAFFGQPEVGVGVVPGGGGTERLPRLIGHDRTLEAILTSADYDADTAERWGWVTRALPDAELDAFVAGVVARLAAFDRDSLADAKRMIGRAALPPESDLVSVRRVRTVRRTPAVSGPRRRRSAADARTSDPARVQPRGGDRCGGTPSCGGGPRGGKPLTR